MKFEGSPPDPMPSDWEERYLAKDTPWNKDRPAPGLVDWSDRNPTPRGGSALVPGCGIGHDAHHLASSGYLTTALDLSPTAIGLARGKYPGIANLHFREGDFLQNPPEEKFDLVFEHTLFCAIDLDRRQDYACSLKDSLKPGGLFLAIHFFIPREQEEPPFGTDLEEVTDLFSPFLELRKQWTPRNFPNREGEEQMFLWGMP